MVSQCISWAHLSKLISQRCFPLLAALRKKEKKTRKKRQKLSDSSMHTRHLSLEAPMQSIVVETVKEEKSRHDYMTVRH